MSFSGYFPEPRPLRVHRPLAPQPGPHGCRQTPLGAWRRAAEGTPEAAHPPVGPAPAGAPRGRAGGVAATVPEPHRQRPGPGTVAIPRPDSRPPPRPLGAASPLPLRSRLPPPPPPGPWPGISPAPPRRPDGGPMEAEMLCGLRAGWGRRRAADAGPGPRALGREPEAEAGGGAGTLAGGGWDETGGRLWGQIASRGEAAEWDSERRRGPPGSAMAAQCDPLSGYLQQPLSDPGSNSERSTDSPVPGSEEDSAGPPRPLHSPEWGEERFRVDRKKLEAMLQGKGGERRRRCPGGRGAAAAPAGMEGGEGAASRPARPFWSPLPALLLSVPRGGGRRGGSMAFSSRGCAGAASARGLAWKWSRVPGPPLSRLGRAAAAPGTPRGAQVPRRAGPGVASRAAPEHRGRCEAPPPAPGRACSGAAAAKGSGSREALPTERRPWKRAPGSPLSRNASEGLGVAGRSRGTAASPRLAWCPGGAACPTLPLRSEPGGTRAGGTEPGAPSTGLS